MYAARFYDQRDVRVEDVDADEVGSNQVRVDVAACGICGTDLHEYVAGPIFVPGEAHPLTGVAPPVTLGHEFGGIVSEVGDDVAGLAEGDAVAVNPVVACESCRYCDAGQYHLCETVAFTGLSDTGGGFARSAVVDAQQAIPFPDSLPLEHAALVEPLTVGLHAVRQSGLAAGDSAAVFGSGPIGLSVVQAARAAGATDVLVSEPRESRRALAADCGATTLIDPTEEDAVERIAEHTDGGADVTFEVAGKGATYSQAVAAAKHDGSVTVVSIFEGAIETNPNDVVLGERSITGTLAYHGGPRADEEFGATISMLDEGVLDPEPLVTARIGLDDIVEDGFEALLDDESGHVKVLVEP